MKVFKQHSLQLFTMIGLALLLIGGDYGSTKNSPPFHAPNIKEANLCQEKPGWEDDLKLFKYRETKDVPKNLALYYHKIYRQGKIRFRTGSQLENVEELGPSNISGRSRAYLIDADNPNHHFAGSVSGGLWESWDAGKTWLPQSDHDENMSVTYIAQNPFNHDIIYYSTGEVYGSGDVNGVGVFKSEDRGQSFRLLPDSERSELSKTWRVVCSPTNPNTLYVASYYGAFVSKNAGETFERFYSGQCSDLEVTKDGNIFMGIPDIGILKGSEGDLTNWKTLELPYLGGDYFRVEIAIAPSEQHILYASFASTHEFNYQLLAIVRSGDGGNTWKRVQNPQVYTAQSGYNLVLSVHPQKPNTVVFGNVTLAYSNNGGMTWEEKYTPHADLHLALFDPHDPNHMILTSDGGLASYRFQGDQLKFDASLKETFNVTQYYAGDYFPDANRVIAGAQDNGTTVGGEGDQRFRKVYWNDGAYTAVAKDDPGKVLCGTQRGVIYLNRSFDKNQLDFKPIISFFAGGRGGNNYFIAPYYLNPRNSEELLFMKLQSLWYTPNLGKTWIAVDENFYAPYNGVFIREDDGLHIIAGGGNNTLNRYELAQDGRSFGPAVDLTENAPTILKKAFIRGIAVEPKDSQSLMVCYSTFSPEPRIWLVDNIFDEKNTTWTNISGDLPPFLPVNDIAVSVVNPDEMAAATDYGVYTTMDRGIHWQRDPTIPNVAVFQVKIRPRDNKLFVFTHGRGAWMADFPPVVATKSVDKVDLNISLFPNPASHFIHIKQLEKMVTRYEIVSTEGRTLLKGELKDKETVISVAHLSHGNYFLRCFDDQRQMEIIKHFVKM